MENNMIKILDDNGNLVSRKVLFTFECEELNKSYIAYEEKMDEITGEQIINVASYDKETDLNKFQPITDPDELKMVNEVLEQIMKD